MEANHLGDKGAERLADLIIRNSFILKLFLKGELRSKQSQVANKITDQGIRALSGAIMKNRTLEELDLSCKFAKCLIKGNSFKDEGAAIFSAALKSNSSLKAVSLRMSVGDKSIQHLLDTNNEEIFIDIGRRASVSLDPMTLSPKLSSKESPSKVQRKKENVEPKHEIEFELMEFSVQNLQTLFQQINNLRSSVNSSSDPKEISLLLSHSTKYLTPELIMAGDVVIQTWEQLQELQAFIKTSPNDPKVIQERDQVRISYQKSVYLLQKELKTFGAEGFLKDIKGAIEEVERHVNVSEDNEEEESNQRGREKKVQEALNQYQQWKRSGEEMGKRMNEETQSSYQNTLKIFSSLPSSGESLEGAMRHLYSDLEKEMKWIWKRLQGFPKETIEEALRSLLGSLSYQLQLLEDIQADLHIHLRRVGDIEEVEKLVRISDIKNEYKKLTEECKAKQLKVKVSRTKYQHHQTEHYQQKLFQVQKDYTELRKQFEEFVFSLRKKLKDHYPELFLSLGIQPNVEEDWLESVLDRKLISHGRHKVYSGDLGNARVVLKEYSLSSPKAQKSFRKELRILASLSHPRVISLLKVIYDEPHAFLVFPYYPMSLDDYIKNNQTSPLVLQTIWKDICHGLEYLHNVGIVHRDIKPQNILLTDSLSPLISDFDVSHQEDQLTVDPTMTLAGTLDFMAPEVMRNEKATSASDMFSFGKLIQMTKGNIRNLLLNKLVTRLINQRPEDRPSASKVLNDEYFVTSIQLLDQESKEMRKKLEEYEKKEILILEEGEKLRNDQKNLEEEKKRLKSTQNHLKRQTVEQQKTFQEKEKQLEVQQKKIQENMKRNKQEQKKIKEKESMLMKEKTIIAFPWYWSSKELKMDVLPSEVDDTFKMKNRIQIAIDQSCFHGNLGKGVDQKIPGQYSNIVVKKVIRIENSSLWSQYCVKKEIILAQHGPALKKLSAASMKNQNWMRKSGMSESLNELYLFHGTSKEGARHIRQQGFDERVSNLGGLYGGGIYFAENSSKSDQYATQDGNGRFYMFVARVCMGSYMEAQAPQSHVRRAPVRNDKPSAYYDSLLGTAKVHREFIVYDRSQCYPEFLLEYERR